MDKFTYIDIFETKGIEYLIIISFFAILIPFWIIINKKSDTAVRIKRALGILTAGVLRIPQGLLYSKNHTWAHLEKSGNAKVGLDDFLLQVIGEVEISHVKSAGDWLGRGELLAEISQGGKHLRILSPISGTIVKTNVHVSENPGILHDDPYGKGWIYAIRPDNWKEEINSFYLAGEATGWLTREIDRFRDFLASSTGRHSPEPVMIALQDGGELRRNILTELNQEIWEDFEASFLKD
jgi:glycine cleavage system H protein